ncbi:MAG TPA: hypothetical protein VKU36_00670 [Candidatus Babeliales bacterium]|nr:hypothetical protein [Candidatus Babeliales bacterium]
MKQYIFGLMIGIFTMQAMEQQQSSKQRVNFLLDSNFHIKQYSAENMKYPVEPPKFIGKNFFFIVPLHELEKAYVKEAFKVAVEKSETVKIPYTLNNQKFYATITVLNRPSCAYDYFVKIKPAGK